MKFKFSDKMYSFLSNSGWLIGEKVFQMMFSLIIGAITARYLGPTNYGVINYAMSYVVIFGVICSLGLDGIVIREIIKEPKKSGEIMGTVMVMRLVTSIVSISVLFIFIRVIEPNNTVLQWVCLLESISLIFKMYEIIDLWFQSKLKSKYSVMAKCIATFSVGMWKVFLIVKKASVEWFALSITIEAIVCFIFLGILYLKNREYRLTFKLSLVKTLLKSSYHLLLASLMVVIYTRIDKIMLGVYMSEEAVGIYSAAVTISDLWIFIPLALINSARPIIMESRSVNKEIYEKRITQVYALVIYMGIFASIAISLFAKLGVTILYGKEYIEAVAPLLILVWGSIFSILGVVREIWIICENKNKYLKYFAGMGALMNVILNLLLVKPFGIIGVAIATLISQAVVAVIAPAFFKDVRVSIKHMFKALCLKGVFERK
ncbi:flippase [Clostridium sp.]|uniref:flippase n=1 Tax=Clostridium sp. TaxID=1506 RepID=UPI0032169EF3